LTIPQPLMLECEYCGEEMYPEYYQGIHGRENRIEDMQSNQKDQE